MRHGPILGRNDDMLIIGGVNFFPSQLESILLGFDEIAPHYTILVHKQGRLDSATVECEATPQFWTNASEDDTHNLSGRIKTRAKDILGFGLQVRILEPKTVERVEGKAKRVIDSR